VISGSGIAVLVSDNDVTACMLVLGFRVELQLERQRQQSAQPGTEFVQAFFTLRIILDDVTIMCFNSQC
jgi:hypothetical protein